MTQSLKASWTVVTVNVQSTSHIYDLPAEKIEHVKEYVETMNDLITGAFGGRYPLLVMLNPSIVYNPSHIVSIRFDAFGSEELEALQEQTQRKLGFSPPSNSN